MKNVKSENTAFMLGVVRMLYKTGKINEKTYKQIISSVKGGKRA